MCLEALEQLEATGEREENTLFGVLAMCACLSCLTFAWSQNVWSGSHVDVIGHVFRKADFLGARYRWNRCRFPMCDDSSVPCVRWKGVFSCLALAQG